MKNFASAKYKKGTGNNIIFQMIRKGKIFSIQALIICTTLLSNFGEMFDYFIEGLDNNLFHFSRAYNTNSKNKQLVLCRSTG